MSDNVSGTLRQYIVENFLFGQDSDISDNDSLMNNGVIDSTGLLEVVTFLENEFKVAVKAHELVPENFDSIAQITRFVASKRGK
jgi:acyl carrier protein